MSTFGFDSIIHLLGRHPELAKDDGFNAWLQKHGGELWHETHIDDKGHQTVVIQSTDRRSIFAALLQTDTSLSVDGSTHEQVVRKVDFNLLSDKAALTDVTALRVLLENHPADSAKVQASRPVIDFTKEPPELLWEVEIKDRNQVLRFVVDSSMRARQLDNRIFDNFLSTRHEGRLTPLMAMADDSTDESELHHLSQYAPMARDWTQGVNTPADKAFRIWLNVRQKMAYDLNVKHISEFTWSDSLAIGQLGWRGICDEWAVVQITMLRAIGIPAVIKFLIWNRNGQAVGHACLEWRDGNNWRHMDALWNAFDNRAVYRQNGSAQNLTVMDASFPRDSRSTVPAWGVPDPTGDLKLYPYGDYIISPGYPGNPRPGYSY